MARRAKNTPSHDVEYRGTGLYASLGFAIVLLVAILIVAVQNTETVDFEFLVWDISFPLFGLIVIGAIAAVILDELVGLVWRRSRRRRLSEREELQRLRREKKDSQTVSDQGASAPGDEEPAPEGVGS